MMIPSSLLLLSTLPSIRSQLIGRNEPEFHPSMSWQNCTGRRECHSKTGKVVLDANWRWLHKTDGSTNCYIGNRWDRTLCPDNKACANNCALEGADYSGTYGIRTRGSSLSLSFVTKGQYSTNVGSRLYLMDETDSKYEMFNLLNKEFTFDIDISQIPCGMNSALYFVSMDADGGMSKYPTNRAGAKYGTGYCDAQCRRDMKFINGMANVEGWQPSSGDKNSGLGKYGSCCTEMDVWEANSMSAAVTPHSCKTNSQTVCEGEKCGGIYSEDRYAGICDPDGCDFNSFRLGDRGFYGKGKTVDTSKKFTVVTQFVGTPLREIKRFYIQNGTIIRNSDSKIPGIKGNSITPEFCEAQKKAFGENNTFNDRGGFSGMSDALEKGMVLVMSLWDDYDADMSWLDSSYPLERNTNIPGTVRGECLPGAGRPSNVEASNPNAQVIFSNIRYGDIASTFHF